MYDRREGNILLHSSRIATGQLEPKVDVLPWVWFVGKTESPSSVSGMSVWVVWRQVARFQTGIVHASPQSLVFPDVMSKRLVLGAMWPHKHALR